MSSRTGTPQPWQNGQTANGGAAGGGNGGLQLPQGKAGKGSNAAGGRSNSQEPTGETNGKSTNVDSLMDAVGASGVDLGAEEESLRASNERAHAQAMANAAASDNSAAAQANAYNGIDRSRKQEFIDPSVLAECVKKVAAAFSLKTLEPDTIPLIALATRHRLQSLINSSISARDHRQTSSHFRPPPFVPAPSTRKRRRRKDPMNGDMPEDDEDEEMGSEEESEEEEDEISRAKRPKVPAWDSLVYDDPERYLAVMERVDRAEEQKFRKERMNRDFREQRERETAEEIYGAEEAQKRLEEVEAKDGSGVFDETGSDGEPRGDRTKGSKKSEGKGKGKAKNAADRFLAANNQSDSSAPSTPTKELGKDGKPKKKKKSKLNADGTTTPGGGGAGGASTPSGTSTPSATSIAKNMSEDARKRLTDHSAMKSLGGTKYSWMNAAAGPSTFGSPSPATPSLLGGGVSSSLGRPKFTPSQSSWLGGGNAGLSSLNPANNTPISAKDPSLLNNALTTSRLNVAPLHDAQRTQIAKEEWEAGHHVVEMGDLLFAMDMERGVGVGRGSGRNTALRGRAGITKSGHRGSR